MSLQRDRYQVAGVDLFPVRNRNEKRVAETLQEELSSMGNPEIAQQTILDAYALALNRLPSRYSQRGTIVLRDPVRKEDIRQAVKEALQHVLSNPKP